MCCVYLCTCCSNTVWLGFRSVGVLDQVVVLFGSHPDVALIHTAARLLVLLELVHIASFMSKRSRRSLSCSALSTYKTMHLSSDMVLPVGLGSLHVGDIAPQPSVFYGAIEAS